ncbi:NF038122 family metalloprotease [Pseudoduganella sp. LjRoot289]|uniref:NF038122 family metalloprotease n=1 Tax=Pseudoduganella sp. LjRoot289 TaxID=3342314 RepID=UPI003ECCF8F2
MKIVRATITALTVAAAFAAPAGQAAPVFNFQFTPGTSAQAQQGFIDAAARWSATLTDNITVNLTVGTQALGGGILGQAASAQHHHAYASYRSALDADRTSPLDNTAVAHLPATTFGMLINHTANNPNGASSATPYLDNNGSSNNTTVFISNAQAKALAMPVTEQALPGCIGNCDGFIQFNSNLAFDFNSGDGIGATQYDFVGMAAHEIGHTLGFISGVDVLDFNAPPNNGPFNDDEFTYVSGLDLYRYSPLSAASGAIDWTADARAKYFSIDGGTTLGPQFSTGPTFGDGRQASHWKDLMMLGLMDPTAALGELLPLTANDRMAMDAIGYSLAPVPEASQAAMYGAALLMALAWGGRRKYFHGNIN